MGKATGGSRKDLPSKATEEIKIKKEPTRKVVSSQKKGFLGNASPAKSKGVNKVFVTATTNGILLLRTERPYSKDDAFTNTFGEKLTSDPDYAAKLNIQKVCNRRESSQKNVPIITPRGWNSKQYVSINDTSEAENEDFRKKWAEDIVDALNKVDWTWGQSFMFCGDETLTPPGKMDRYLMNEDIAGILGTYVFENVDEVLSNEDALQLIFENKSNIENASSILCSNWLSWSTTNNMEQK